MTQRSFIVGSEWLYYKIYSGPKASDLILTEIVLPCLQSLKERNCIEKWFFIRYADPKHHIRLRFLVSDKKHIPIIMDELFVHLEGLIAKDIVWKVQLDTYHRELERYGDNTMELSESLFCADSLATIRFLDLIEGDEGEELRWLFGLRAIEVLLSCFQYGLDEKLGLMEQLKIGFGREFNMSRPLKKQLDDKYRKEREGIEQFMRFTAEEEPDYIPILDILGETHNKIAPIAKKILEVEKKDALQMSKNNLMGSYIHMLMNRLFKSKNRLNEMVCYDFLYRHYRTKKARRKS
ncbi:MAG: thiopeptide-type bacteriocin biosynthesis protein [Bacteroidota bacterium]